jgi:ATP-dependent Zn protease
MLMAGRAAEELLLGCAFAGAGGFPGSDLSRATEIAKDMELRFGFGELGPVFLSGEIHEPLLMVPGVLSKVIGRLRQAMVDASGLLKENRAALEAIAGALDRSGYLSPAEIAELMGETTCTEIVRKSQHGVLRPDCGPAADAVERPDAPGQPAEPAERPPD